MSGFLARATNVLITRVHLPSTSMPRVILVAMLSAAVLSACTGRLVGPLPAAAIGDPRSQSIGFTGIGPEPF